LTGLIETASIPYVGLDVEALSLDEKAEILFADQAYGTVVLATFSHCVQSPRF